MRQTTLPNSGKELEKKLPCATARAFLAMVAVLFLPSCTPNPALDTGLSHERLQVDGVERTYYLHLPPIYESAAMLPVVLILHGGGRADGDEVAARLGYDEIADSERFIAVYPNGVDAQWNDGRGSTFRNTEDGPNVDDVGFIAALIDEMVRAYKGDSSRIYVTGVSNGGMMALRLGCELGSRLAAIAPVIANIPKNIIEGCLPDSPLPVLVMNGTDDPIIPWEGGPVTLFGREMGEVVSTEETVGFWVARNQCDPTPEVSALPDTDTADQSTVTVSTYGNPTNGNEVVLYTIEGGGHSFPGSNVPDRPRIVGIKNNDINGSEVIWEFFQKHAK